MRIVETTWSYKELVEERSLFMDWFFMSRKAMGWSRRRSSSSSSSCSFTSGSSCSSSSGEDGSAWSCWAGDIVRTKRWSDISMKLEKFKRSVWLWRHGKIVFQCQERCLSGDRWERRRKKWVIIRYVCLSWGKKTTVWWSLDSKKIFPKIYERLKKRLLLGIRLFFLKIYYFLLFL